MFIMDKYSMNDCLVCSATFNSCDRKGTLLYVIEFSQLSNSFFCDSITPPMTSMNTRLDFREKDEKTNLNSRVRTYLRIY